MHDGLLARGLRIAEFHPVPRNDQAEKLAKRAAKAGAPAILVGGGDGTMTHAVNALAHSSSVLGVLPLGTGNSFAQSLGIQPDLDGALDAIAGGHVARVDLGWVNGRYFANFATVGISSTIAASTAHGVKAVLGKLAYVVAAIPQLLRHRAFEAKIRWDDGKLKLCTQDIIVAGGRFFGASPITDDASLTSGKIVLYTTENTSMLGELRTYLAFGRGTQTKLPDAHVINATEFRIEAHPRQAIALDGSPFQRTPAHFRVVPRALRAFVPATGVPR